MPTLTVNLALDALGGGVAPADTIVTVRRLNEVTRTVEGVTYLVSPRDIVVQLTNGQAAIPLNIGYYWVHRKGGPSKLVMLNRDARLDELDALDPANLEPTDLATVAAWEDKPSRAELATAVDLVADTIDEAVAGLPTRDEVAAAVAGARAGKGCRLFLSGAQDAALATVADVELNATERNDDDDLFAVDLDAHTVTVNAPGLFLLSWSIKFGAGGIGERYASVSVNGATVRESGLTTATSYTSSGSDSLRLEAGDVIRLRYYLDGGAVRLNGSAFYATGLSVTLLGD